MRRFVALIMLLVAYGVAQDEDVPTHKAMPPKMDPIP